MLVYIWTSFCISIYKPVSTCYLLFIKLHGMKWNKAHHHNFNQRCIHDILINILYEFYKLTKTQWLIDGGLILWLSAHQLCAHTNGPCCSTPWIANEKWFESYHLIQHQYNNSIQHQYNNSIQHQYNNSMQHQYNNSIQHQYNNSIQHQYNNSIQHHYNNSILHQYNNLKINSSTLKMALSRMSLSGRFFRDSSRVVWISSFQSLVWPGMCSSYPSLVENAGKNKKNNISDFNIFDNDLIISCIMH